MPATQSQKPNTKESMYFYMLAHELDDQSQEFLVQTVFADQDALLSSLDLSKQPDLVTKTDVAVNDKTFLDKFSHLLRETQNMKIDQSVLDNMLKSLYKASSQKSNASTQYKVAFIEALLGERKFLINLVRSLLRIVLNQTNKRIIGSSGGQYSGSKHKHDLDKQHKERETLVVAAQPLTANMMPHFQNDPFLMDEFSKYTNGKTTNGILPPRSQSSMLLSPSKEAKTNSIQHLLQPKVKNAALAKSPSYNLLYDPKNLSSRAQYRQQQQFGFDNEYQGEGGAQMIDKSKQFSFAEKTTNFNNNTSGGIYYSSALQQHQHLTNTRSELNASNSPSFGNLSNKSPHSQQHLRKSRKKTVLGEYNHLFKRKETVQLRHKWETDDEDEAADVTSSETSQDEEEDQDHQMTNIDAAQVTQSDQNQEQKNQKSSALADGYKKSHRTNTALSTSRNANAAGGGGGSNVRKHSKTPSVNTRRVQKPEQKNLIGGKRANVRTSDKKGGYSRLLNEHNSASAAKSSNGKNQRSGVARPQTSTQQYQSLFSQTIKNQSTEESSYQVQGFQQNNATTNLVNQQQQPHQTQQKKLNSARPNHPPPNVALQKQMQKSGSYNGGRPATVQQQVSGNSRNNKQGDFYTKSVPQLGGQSQMQEDHVHHQQDDMTNLDKLGQDTEIEAPQMAMTMSPPKSKKQNEVNGLQTQNHKSKIANPMYTSATKFERTFQSISKAQTNKDYSRSPTSDKNHSSHQNMRTSNSPYRYTDEEYKEESLCEPHDLEKQLRLEQEFEYASHQSSSLNNHNLNQKQSNVKRLKKNGQLLPADKALGNSVKNAMSGSRSSSQLMYSVGQKSSKQVTETTGEQDEYELQNVQKRQLNSSSTSKMRMIGGLSTTSKQSQSKLLATSTISSQKMLDGSAQAKKTSDKDQAASKSNFSQQQLQQNTQIGKLKPTQRSMVSDASKLLGSKQNQNQNQSLQKSQESKTMLRNQANRHGRTTDMQKSVDAQNMNSQQIQIVQPSGNNIFHQNHTRYTSDTASVTKHSPKLTTNHQQIATQNAVGAKTTSSISQRNQNLSNAKSKKTSQTNQSRHQNTDTVLSAAEQMLQGLDKNTVGSGEQVILSGVNNINLNHGAVAALTKQEEYGGVKLNVHHESSHHTSSYMMSQSNNPGAFPVLQNSGKSSLLEKNQIRKSGNNNDRRQSDTDSDIQSSDDDDPEDEDQKSCYDEDSRTGMANQKGDNFQGADKVNQITRYTQELMADSSSNRMQIFSNSNTDRKKEVEHNRLGSESLNLIIDGPQTFVKESEDGDDDIRQQIVFVVDNSGANGQDLKVSIAHNMDEPQSESEHLSKNEQLRSSRPSQLRSQVHELYQQQQQQQHQLQQPSGPGEQNIIQEERQQFLQKDFGDDSALFDHLNDSEADLKRDQSRQESYEPQSDLSYMRESMANQNLNQARDMSDKDRVSFNLANMSGIVKLDNASKNGTSHQSKQSVALLSNRSANTNNQHQRISSNKPQSSDQRFSNGTQNTQKSTRLRPNMQLNAQNTNNNNHLSKNTMSQQQQKQKEVEKSKQNDSTVRSVNIDLPQNNTNSNNNLLKKNSSSDQQNNHQQRPTGTRNDKNSRSSYNQNNLQQTQLTQQIHQPAPLQHPDTMIQHNHQFVKSNFDQQDFPSLAQIAAKNKDLHYKGENGAMGKRDQTIVSQDFFSEDSMAGQSLTGIVNMQKNSSQNKQVQQQTHDSKYNDKTELKQQQQQLQDEEIEDATRDHRLSQVRMELYRGQEIRNSLTLGKFSNRHQSSSDSERSCSSTQFKNQLNSIRNGSQEQSPNAKQQPSQRKKERKNIFFHVDQSPEREVELQFTQQQQEQELFQHDQYGVAQKQANAVSHHQQRSSSSMQGQKHLKLKNTTNDQVKRQSTIRGAFSPMDSSSSRNKNSLYQEQQQRKQTQNESSRNYFGLGGAQQEQQQEGLGGSNLSSGGGLSQDDLDESYNKFIMKQKSRRL